MTLNIIILIILIILNGINCIIVGNINRYILVKIGKIKSVFGISKVSDFTSLFRLVKSDKTLIRYKGFVYYMMFSYLFQVILFFLLLVCLAI